MTGRLVFATKKGRVIPPPLQRIIDASPTGDLNFLTTEYGQPFIAAGFDDGTYWCARSGFSSALGQERTLDIAHQFVGSGPDSGPR